MKLFKVVLLFLFINILITGQQLPTAKEIAEKIKIAWNIGNSLEVPGGETGWGNPIVTQQLIDSVYKAGFNTIRIPCAWDSYADTSTLIIDTNWFARVKEVVDYCYTNNMYVLINIHWDGGWLENNVKSEKQDEVKKKQKAYWTQIAEYFKDYDEHLLFASANEPNASNASQMNVLLSYHQTFVDAVRETGGNNSSRILVIQGPKTDIDKTNDLMKTLPEDTIEDRLMVEIHYYTPWNFCGLEKDESWGKMFYFWGEDNHSTTNTTRNPTWGEESTVESLFDKMKTKFVDKGIPVIMGEYGAIKRSSLTGENLELHIQSREYYFEYVTEAAKRYGLIPMYWDNGYNSNNGFGLFNRNNGAVTDRGAIEALFRGANTATDIEEDNPKVGQNSDDNFIYSSPNPALASSVFHVHTTKNSTAKISIYNILGKEVAKFENLNFRTGKNSITWNSGNLAAGTYVVRVNLGQNVLTSKLLLLH